MVLGRSRKPSEALKSVVLTNKPGSKRREAA
jgi:hypothetical protein